MKYMENKEGKKMVIGITGSSGAGKSTICNMLQKDYKVKIINADSIAKKLSKKGTNYIIDIIDKFGKDIVDDEGELRRKRLAEIIYTDPEKRKELNNCTFKYIRKEIEKQVKKENDTDTTVIIDAPLLFECELDKLCDIVIGIISKREMQIERIVARDNVDYESAEKRLNAQQTNKFYIKKCDEIIENNNNLVNIEKEVKEIVKKYDIKEK